jgi:hypothetical protein
MAPEAAVSVRESLTDWLGRSSTDDEDAVLRSVTSADEGEVRAALEVLWPLTRSVTREECWELLSLDDQDQTCLREEIRAHLDGSPQRDEALKGLAEAWRQRDDRESRLSAMVEAARALTGGGPERHLPPASSIDTSVQTPRAVAVRFRRGFPVLRRLCELVAPLLASDRMFLAVLGPVHDALCWRNPQGFAEEIKEARVALIDRRLRDARADLYDAWQWFRSRTDEEEQLEASDAVLDVAERTPINELEAFFSWWAYDDDDEDEAIVIPEVLLPDPERLWLRILRRPGISRDLFARAGEFFWETSADRRGPAEALAALALRWETDFDFAEITWAVFWKAFEDAAERARWDLAVDCLNRALVHIGGRARVNAEDLASQLDKYRPSIDHLEETCLRFFDDREHSPRVLLSWAWDAMAQTPALSESRLGRGLRRVRGIAPIQTGEPWRALPEKLGHDLWTRLDTNTRVLLHQAEELWVATEGGTLLSEEYGLIGAAFRRAVEYEWRVRLQGVPGLSGDELGRMIRDLREFGPIGWGMVRQRFGASSALTSQQFLGEAQTFCAQWLNPGAHGTVLDRGWAEELRRQLWVQGRLHDLLSAVQGSE